MFCSVRRLIGNNILYCVVYLKTRISSTSSMLFKKIVNTPLLGRIARHCPHEILVSMGLIRRLIGECRNVLSQKFGSVYVVLSFFFPPIFFLFFCFSLLHMFHFIIFDRCSTVPFHFFVSVWFSFCSQFFCIFF